MKVRVGVAQFSPVHLNLEKSLVKLESIIKKASGKSIELLVFGETWLSGYPAWLDHCPGVALWDHQPMKDIFYQFHKNSFDVNGEERKLLENLCAEHKMSLCIGINEKVSQGRGQGTIYNSILTFNKKGKLVNHHRKLMPTFSEKLVYGLGDGKGLNAVDINGVNVGSLVCWEHWMPLSRQALHDQGEHVHVALWPMVKEMNMVASQHYAFEGRCFVVAVGQIMKVGDIPKGIKKPGSKKPTDLLLNGGSCVIAPDGSFLMKQLKNKEKLQVVDLDLSKSVKEKMTLDTSGHYQRPDVFSLRINKKRN